MPEIIYKDKIINYTHLITKRIKNAYITIDENNNVVLKSRSLTRQEADKIILGKAEWILKKTAVVKENKRLDFVNGSILAYMGEDYIVKIIEDSYIKKVSVDFSFGNANIRINPSIPLENRKVIMQKCIDEFYLSSCKNIITNMVNYWSEFMGLYPVSISFKKLKGILGSCSHDNKLLFNTNILKYSTNIIDYVIVHELAHISEKNHSKNFWDLVEKYIPDRKEIHKVIKNIIL